MHFNRYFDVNVTIDLYSFYSFLAPCWIKLRSISPREKQILIKYNTFGKLMKFTLTFKCCYLSNTKQSSLMKIHLIVTLASSQQWCLFFYFTFPECNQFMWHIHLFRRAMVTTSRIIGTHETWVLESIGTIYG